MAAPHGDTGLASTATSSVSKSLRLDCTPRRFLKQLPLRIGLKAQEQPAILLHLQVGEQGQPSGTFRGLRQSPHMVVEALMQHHLISNARAHQQHTLASTPLPKLARLPFQPANQSWPISSWAQLSDGPKTRTGSSHP